METLIANARLQFKKFGHVKVTHYLDRSYQEKRELELSLGAAIDLIKDVFNSEEEDIDIQHPNFF